MTTPQNCSNCVFRWANNTCRRYPPTPKKINQHEVYKYLTEHKAIWPEVRPNNWCGEWRQRLIESGSGTNDYT